MPEFKKDPTAEVSSRDNLNLPSTNTEFYRLKVLFNTFHSSLTRFQEMITLATPSGDWRKVAPYNAALKNIQGGLAVIDEALNQLNVFEVDIYQNKSPRSDFDEIQKRFCTLILDFKDITSQILREINQNPTTEVSDRELIVKYISFYNMAIKQVQDYTKARKAHIKTPSNQLPVLQLVPDLLIEPGDYQVQITELKAYIRRVRGIILAYANVQIHITITHAEIIDTLQPYLELAKTNKDAEFINIIIGNLNSYLPNGNNKLDSTLKSLSILPEQVRAKLRKSLNYIANEITLESHASTELTQAHLQLPASKVETKSSGLIYDLTKYSKWLDCALKINLPKSSSRNKFYGFFQVLNELYRLNPNESLVKRFTSQEGEKIAHAMDLSFCRGFLKKTANTKMIWRLLLKGTTPGYRAIIEEVDGRVKILYVGPHTDYEIFLK